MTAYRFKIEIGGAVRAGLLFDSEAELETWLIGRPPLAAFDETRRRRDHLSAPVETARPGRPSFDAIIAEAIDVLGDRLDPGAPLAARARTVQKAIAAAHRDDPAAIPGVRAIERFLAQLRQNPRQNYRQNSEAATPAGGRRRA